MHRISGKRLLAGLRKPALGRAREGLRSDGDGSDRHRRYAMPVEQADQAAVMLLPIIPAQAQGVGEAAWKEHVGGSTVERHDGPGYVLP
jgi:hypothetical protein